MPPIKKSKLPRGYPRIGKEEFFGALAGKLSSSELEAVEAAYAFAKGGHRSQYRDGGYVRYFEHLKAVAWILISEFHVVDADTIIVALLHDILEDTYLLTPHRIQLNFGTDVLRDVESLTKSPKKGLFGYVAHLTLHASPRAQLVKLCDRIHNLRTLYSCPRRKQIKQIKETKAFFIPLARSFALRTSKGSLRLGRRIEEELDALCRRYERKLDASHARH